MSKNKPTLKEALWGVVCDFYLHTECEEHDYKLEYLKEHPNAGAIPMTQVFNPAVAKAVGAILSLLKEELLEGLTVIGREEWKQIDDEHGGIASAAIDFKNGIIPLREMAYRIISICDRVAEKQLSHTIKEIKENLGDDQQ